MTINSVIQTSRPTVTELLENMRNDSYFVDDSFQRRLVWTEKQKVRLVQTVLMGFPMPEIYLWQQKADPESGRQAHSIVDGQQRLTALLQYTANEWPLKLAYLDPENGRDDYVDKYWKDIPAGLKQSFWQYVINVRIIPTNIEQDQIIEVFRRLNETDKSLNPQELRNAVFNGEFINAAEKIADSEHLSELRPFSDASIRRMGDIEFASSILMFLRKGLVEENTKTINEVYDIYNDEYLEANDDIKVATDFFERCIKSYLIKDVTRKFFSRPVNLFTLFCVERLVNERKIEINLVDGLNKFANEYNGESTNEFVIRYREGASSRTRSRSSRNARINALIGFVTV